jgi:predicted phage terminase large subunit-like protein
MPAIARVTPWPIRAQAELELRRRRAAAAPVEEVVPVVEPGPIFAPQSAPQEAFARSTADIAILGGSVFGGKSWALTFEPTKYLQVPGFTSVTFRRVTPEIRNPGGIWVESMGMYPFYSGTPREHSLEWDFPSGAKVKFAGLQHESDVLNWKSSQICLLQFDQLEEFTESQFWYMLSRNRSTCGVTPRVRASCNPDPDSFLVDFLAWWIDQDGYAIPERSGKIRWFMRRRDDDLVWADTKEELVARDPELGAHAQSVSFILARLQDNQVGNEKDPQYLSRMRAMPRVEQERLLGGDRGGNWHIRASRGLVFPREKFGLPVKAAPATARRARGWDDAATPGGGDWSVGVKLAHDGHTYYVEDVSRGQWDTDKREAIKHQTAVGDGPKVRIRLEQEPGSAGVSQAKDSIHRLDGFTVRAKPSTGSLIVRSGPFAAQVQAGNVKLVEGAWNEAFLRELDAFPTNGVPDDQVSALLGAYEELLSWVSYDPEDWKRHSR